jgi:pectate lyase
VKVYKGTVMKNILLSVCCVLILNGFSAPAFSTDGWASVVDETGTPYNLTGGAAGTTVTPTTPAQFYSYANNTSTPYVIQISGTMDLSSLSNHTVYVRSNKTIIGVAGTSPTIYGHLDVKNASNVIIQNLNINYNADEGSSDPWTDGITIQDGSHHVWINHCSVYNSPDGLIDIGDGADFITISWCKFFYQSGIYNTSHRYTNLVGSSDSDTGDRGKLRVTFHHNWWADGCNSRMPRVRFGKVHIYNNYYSCTGNDYCIHGGFEAQIRSENNYFNRVDEPFNEKEATALIYSGGDYKTPTCTGVHNDIGGDTVFTPPYPYTLEFGPYILGVVSAGAGAGAVEPCTPAVPIGLKATPNTSSIVLDWNDNTEEYLKGYNVYYTTTPGGTYTRLTSMPITTSTYTHYSLVYGQTYYYAISSISTSWRESAYSSSVAAIPRIYGDYEINHAVDFNDVSYLSDFWLDSNCDETQDIDHNHDCMINFIEFAAMAENWLTQ